MCDARNRWADDGMDRAAAAPVNSGPGVHHHRLRAMTSEAEYDLLIEDVLLFDGSGEAPVPSCVAVSAGRVAAIGPRLAGAAATERVDGRGCWLMPGLLDIHTHFDVEVEIAPHLPEAVRHGTTTVVVSNCSLGLAFGNQRRTGADGVPVDPIVDCFARVENMPKHVLRRAADRATWRDSAGYLAHLEGLALGPNIVPMIPHSMLRVEVMGLKDSVTREPTESELRAMEGLLDQGLRQGYVGYSTDALPFHYLANDPNRHRRIPGQYGTYRELKRLAAIVRAHGRVWQATPPKHSMLEVVRTFLLTSGRLHGRTLKMTAVAALDIANNGSVAKSGRLLSRLLNSRLLKGNFRLQALAAPFKVWADGPILPLAEEIPELRVLNEPDTDDRDARMAILRDPDWRRRFAAMWAEGKSGFSLARLKRLLKREDYALTRDLADMVVDTCPVDAWNGLTFAEVFDRARCFQAGGYVPAGPAEAAALGAMPRPLSDEAVFLIHLFETYDTDLRWWTVTANRDEAVTLSLLEDPDLIPGFNDSGAHISNMAFYDGNLRGLRLVQRRGLGAVARHVRRLTAEPAELFGVEAGRIAVGAPADLALIDPEALAAYDGEAGIRFVHREDFECRQMVNRSDGVVPGVWVSGRRVWDGEGFPDWLGRERAGRVLKAVA